MPFHRYSPVTADVSREPKRRIAVLILYEDSITGLLAKELFNRMNTQLGSHYDLHWILCRLDRLDLSTVREQATRDAKAADMIVVSGHGDGDWTNTISTWLEPCGTGAAAQNGGLVALLVRSRGKSFLVAKRRSWLEQLACRCGRLLLVREVDLERAGPEILLGKIHALAGEASALLEGLIQRSAVAGDRVKGVSAAAAL